MKREGFKSWSGEATAAPGPKGPQIVYFGASWCGPCKVAKPLVKAAAKKAGLPLRILDIDSEEGERQADKHKVNGVPTVLFLDKHGRRRRKFDLEGIGKKAVYLQALDAGIQAIAK